MPPPALSRLVPELYHVSVDYFVARPGLVLLPVLPYHWLFLATFAGPSRRRWTKKLIRAKQHRGLAVLPLSHARGSFAGASRRMVCGAYLRMSSSTIVCRHVRLPSSLFPERSRPVVPLLLSVLLNSRNILSSLHTDRVRCFALSSRGQFATLQSCCKIGARA